MNNFCIVIPNYNHITVIDDVLSQLSSFNLPIIMVDDASNAEAKSVFSKLDAKYTQLSVVTHDDNQGKGGAVQTGLKQAYKLGFSHAIQVDADGQHDVKELPRLYEIFLEENADFLIGARDFDTGYIPLRSRIGNKTTKVISGLLLGRHLPDTQSGYRLISRNFLEKELDNIPGGRYETEMHMIAIAIRGEYTLASSPIRTIYETGNHSSHFNVTRDSFLIYRKLFGLWISRYLGK